ncbi:MAG: hypothetical protein JSS95_06955 [Acidobacteria bacterium]|nr:hypothetical protein [Acidobacteriota bacterium]
MTFIRKKLIKGTVYHYLVENFREEGKVRQKVIAYLGQFDAVADAYEHWREQLNEVKSVEGKKNAREMLKKLKQYL